MAKKTPALSQTTIVAIAAIIAIVLMVFVNTSLQTPQVQTSSTATNLVGEATSSCSRMFQTARATCHREAGGVFANTNTQSYWDDFEPCYQDLVVRNYASSCESSHLGSWW